MLVWRLHAAVAAAPLEKKVEETAWRSTPRRHGVATKGRTVMQSAAAFREEVHGGDNL